jgi:hypothetical protein
MIIDKNLVFSTAQALTTTATSTDIIDQLAAGAAVESELYLVAEVAVTLTGGTSLQVTLQTDSAVGFGSAVTVLSGAVIAEASLLAGVNLITVKLPVGLNVLKRYLRLNYVTVGAHGAGSVSARLVMDPNVRA